MGVVDCATCRPAVAERVQEQRMGHSAHTAGDVQLPAAPHPASLPHPAAQSAASARPGPADDTVPASSLVRQSCISDSHLLTTYTSARTLHSQDKQLFAVPTVSTVIGRQGFSYAAPSIWNEIPVEIDNCPSLSSSKKHLKTHYSATTPSSPLAIACISDLAQVVDCVHVISAGIELYCIVLTIGSLA